MNELAYEITSAAIGKESVFCIAIEIHLNSNSLKICLTKVASARVSKGFIPFQLLAYPSFS